MPRMPGLILLAIVTAFAGQISHAQSDDKLAKKVEKLDAQLIKVCSDLAKKYDEEKSPEAAHFFASCALGFGAKDDKLTGIKNTWEISVFIGRVRGGQLLKDAEPITSALSGLNQEYRTIRDSLWTPGTRGALSAPATKILRDVGVKMELTQSAHDYIRVTQRFNALRQAMGLRAIFWDFENSSRLILVAWYMGQTGDYDDYLPGCQGTANKGHVLYTPAVEEAKVQTARSHDIDLGRYPDYLRPFPQLRQDLLNPNARTLWFAHWTKAWTLTNMVLLRIPELPYREDIPTPSARFKDETVVKKWSDWIDTEDTIVLGGRKVPYVRYPYDGEPDAPFVSYYGEDGWDKEEYKQLRNTGVPIMLRVFTNAIPTDVKTTLREEGGDGLPCFQYVNGDKKALKLRDWATVLLLPKVPLAPGKRFSVSVECEISGATFQKSWSFTTRKE